MIATKNIGVIILAAGVSSRLGQPKQLLMFQDKSLLQNIINQLQPFRFSPAVLVLGAHAKKIERSIDHKNMNVVINENWKKGIGSSIRKGVERSLEINPALEHILFLLSDQPYVTSDLIRKLIDAQLNHSKAITGCKYQNTVGVPAIFSELFFHELQLLFGDHGAKKIINKHANDLVAIPFESGSVDIDTHEDYNKLLELNLKQQY